MTSHFDASVSWLGRFVGAHVTIATKKNGGVVSGVVRFVGRVLRERQSSVNVVGIVLEERRSIAACKTANGVFAGVPVLQCPPGFGFICPVDFAESNILRSVRGGEAAWYCHSCHAPNVPPSVVSVMDYLELSLEALDALVRCSSCETVRVWYCPHPTCSGLAPLEVAQITERYDGVGGLAVSAMVETMTCPRCLRPPVATWSCPQCDKSNTDTYCTACEDSEVALVPQRDSVLFLQWLMDPKLEVGSLWDSTSVLVATEPKPTPVPVSAPALAAAAAASDGTSKESGGSGSSTSRDAEEKEAPGADRSGGASGGESRRIVTVSSLPKPRLSDGGSGGSERKFEELWTAVRSIDSRQGRATSSGRVSPSLSPRAVSPRSAALRRPDTLFSPVHGVSRFPLPAVMGSAAGGSGKYGKMVKLLRGMGDTYDDGVTHSGNTAMLQQYGAYSYGGGGYGYPPAPYNPYQGQVMMVPAAAMPPGHGYY